MLSSNYLLITLIRVYVAWDVTLHLMLQVYGLSLTRL
jgi:hypothetical protein